jgi:hypothetical protein
MSARTTLVRVPSWFRPSAERTEAMGSKKSRPSVDQRYPRNEGAGGAERRRRLRLRPAMTEPSDYWIWSMIWNIGRYRATTAAPTQPPMIAIRIGSISDVRALTAASTSWS